MRRLLPAPTTVDRGLVVLVAALCGVLVVAATLTSQWLRTTADDMAAAAFADAGHQATQLQVTYVGVRGTSIGDDAAEQVAAALPGTLRAVLTAPRHVTVTSEMVPTVLPRRPAEPAFLSVAGLPGSDDLVEVVEGRRPRPGDPVRALPPEVAAEYEGPRRTTVVEVMLEESAAVELDTPVGSWVVLSGQSFVARGREPATLHVVGTFRATDPFPSPVDDVDALRSPLVSDLPDFNLVRATALAADEETVLGARWEERPLVRFVQDLADAPDAAETAALVEETRRATLQTWPPALRAATVDAGTGLGPIAQTAVDQRTTSDGLVALLLTALAASGGAVLLAAAGVLAARRDRITGVMRARGAGARWLVWQRGAEALLLTVPGVLVAVGVSSWRAGGVPALREVVVAVLAAVVTAALVTATQVVRAPGEQLRIVLRDALQIGLVLLAAGAVALVVTTEALRPDDPVMLLTAPLLGAGAAVVLLRLLQAGLAAVRSLTRRTRAVTGLVSLSQATAVARQVVLPVSALVLAASAGVLAVAVGDSVRAGAEQAGWEQVGADVAVVSTGLDDDLVGQLGTLPGVERVATVFTSDSVSVETRGGIEGVTVLGVDAEDLARVGDATLRDLRLPDDVGDATIAAVASPDLELADEQATLRYAQASVPVQVVDRLDRIPGVTDGGSYLLVDRDALAAAVERPLDTYARALLAGDPDLDEVAGLARSRDPNAVVTTRDQVAEQALGGPVVTRTLALTRVAVAVSLGLAVFAVLLLVGLAAPVRRRAGAVLEVLGGGGRPARRAGVLGLLPAVVTACTAAAASAAVLSVAASRGFDLAGLTGTLAPLPVRPSTSSVLAVLAVLAGLVLLAAVTARPRRTPEQPEAP